MEKKKETKNIRMNITKEEGELQHNIYYVCDKNILISQMNLTINYDEHQITNAEILKIQKEKENYEKKAQKNEEGKRKMTIKISQSDKELTNLYMNDVINDLYNYIFEERENELILCSNTSWYIFINIYIYEYTPFIYDHIINAINVHLSILLVPFCYFDSQSSWYRCIENYEELFKLLDVQEEIGSEKNPNNLSKSNEVNNNMNEEEVNFDDIVILDEKGQNRNILIKQIENSNFDLFVEMKNKKQSGLYKRLLLKCLPIMKTVSINDQYIYLVKFFDYREFLLKTQGKQEPIYTRIKEMYNVQEFKQASSFEMYDSNKDKKQQMEQNLYMMLNANNTQVNINDIMQQGMPLIEYYYKFILKYCQNYFIRNYNN